MPGEAWHVEHSGGGSSLPTSLPRFGEGAHTSFGGRVRRSRQFDNFPDVEKARFKAGFLNLAPLTGLLELPIYISCYY